MKSSKAFEYLCKRYPSLIKLLENQIHGMMAGALNYKHDYLVVEKKIMYKDGDLLSDKVNYGYKTVFAYFHEN